MIKACVILAAGKNCRLDTGKPKSLIEVNKLSLLERHIRNFSLLGIEKFCIITGHNPEPIKQIVPALVDEYAVQIDTIQNENYHLENGYSVSIAESWLVANETNEFFLTMGDHIFQQEFIEQFANAIFLDSDLCLAVDTPSSTNTHIDLDDVTKVMVNTQGYIEQIGKQIPEYNRYDTGLFYMNLGVFPVLKECFSYSKFKISDMVNALVSSGKANTYTLSGYLWNDVDNLNDLNETEKLNFD